MCPLLMLLHCLELNHPTNPYLVGTLLSLLLRRLLRSLRVIGPWYINISQFSSPFGQLVPMVGGSRGTSTSTRSLSIPSRISREEAPPASREAARKGEVVAEGGVSPIILPVYNSSVRCISSSRQLGSAARLPHFINTWRQVTSNSFILNIVQYGYIIQFESEPFQSDFTPRPMSKETITVCMRKVKQFLSNGAIIQVQPSRDQFLSDIFPVIKKSLLDHRIILDLSELNLFVRKVSFKMDSLDYIMNMIRPGDYFISIDISDAYYAIAINASSMPYLTFIFLGLYYQFACLPQGLSSAPRIFTRVMKVVLSFLRTYGIRIAAWLDDLILAAASASLAASHTEQALYTLKALGFLPNYEKSILIPVQRIEHLGLVWDSVAYTVSVPDDKFRDVQKKCGVALSSDVSLRFLSSILGSIEYFRWGFPFAALHYRALQRFVNACLSRDFSYDFVVSVPPAAADLRWWVDTEFLSPRSLVPLSPSITLYSDASLLGWGG